MALDHPLRDLARRIELMAKDHPGYCQAQPAVQNLVDHLCAIARTHEASATILDLEDKIDDLKNKIAGW